MDSTTTMREIAPRVGTEEVEPVGVLLADVAPERVEWLWEGRIPKGKLTLIDGDPGLGKSNITTDAAARITSGRAWPDGSPCEKGGVVLMNAEDGLADTIRPRVDAAGGDVSKVLALATVPDEYGEDRLLSIPDDIPIIERGIRQVGASLVVMDPLMAFLGGNVNSHKDQDIRRALAPLARMAERTGAAVVIVRHLNKATGGSALYRGGGSIGIIGAARAALLVAEDPEDDARRVLASLKHNLAEPAPSLAFSITTAGNGAARVEWQGETTFGAHALLRVPADDEEKSAMAEAMEFLRDALGDGPMAAKAMQRDAAAADISKATLNRAKQALKVRSVKEGDGSWSWHLPGKERHGKVLNDSHVPDDENLENVLKDEHLENLAPEHTLHTLRSAYISEDIQGTQDTQGMRVGAGEHLRKEVA